MHLIYYGRNVLDLHGLSTQITVALIAGAGWGLFRAVVDVVFICRGGNLFRPPPKTPRIRNYADEERLLAAVRRAIDAERRDQP